jgi:hypothetical protein
MESFTRSRISSSLKANYCQSSDKHSCCAHLFYNRIFCFLAKAGKPPCEGFGVFQEWNYQQREVQLYPGDKVLLYTDGIIQVKNYDGKEFGKERVIGLIVGNKSKSSKALQKILTSAVEEFCGEELQDDIALIVISVQ